MQQSEGQEDFPPLSNLNGASSSQSVPVERGEGINLEENPLPKVWRRGKGTATVSSEIPAAAGLSNAFNALANDTETSELQEDGGTSTDEAQLQEGVPAPPSEDLLGNPDMKEVNAALEIGVVDDSQEERLADLLPESHEELDRIFDQEVPNNSQLALFNSKTLGPWADVGDDEMIAVETRGTKGRLQEDKSHTPDRGNVSKKRHTASSSRSQFSNSLMSPRADTPQVRLTYELPEEKEVNNGLNDTALKENVPGEVGNVTGPDIPIMDAHVPE
ncbi:hypothetical protein R1sor_009648 [Riccia sorocarpa]|uniref:Uncharacterized protein n=1 Tax=Riccia sorocarpa TaxID=122646 RepID=A0ABD3HYH1_9MARC